MEERNEKTNKKIYKKWWFIVIVVILSIILITNIANDLKNSKKINWSTVELGQYLPKPDKTNGRLNSNSSTSLNIVLTKIDEDGYKIYKIKCKEAGYTIDEEDSSTSFLAFNSEGYKISLNYTTSGKELSIYLDAPEKLEEIEWPTSGLGAMLPTPKSNLGKITWDSSKGFTVHIGNTSIKEFSDYVKSCEDKGFTIDHSKSSKSYYAKNTDGYKISLGYSGCNRISISIDAPSSSTNDSASSAPTTSSTATPTPKESEKTSSSATSSSSGLRPEFKKAMDSYESFMNEYVTFMKKYLDSNGTDVSLLADYSKYMNKYAEACKDFEKWNGESLNNEETAYYIDVQARISKKLLEIQN